MQTFENIQGAENGFSTIRGSFTAEPLFSYFKAEGWSKEGIQWADVEPVTKDVGADGLGTNNTRPVVYEGTASFKPNSSTRGYLDRVCTLSNIEFGKTPTAYELTYTEINYLTNTKTIYSGGSVTTFQSGNSATMDDGQQDKKYIFKFFQRVILPL